MSSERLVVREIGGFSLVRELGEGGMGKVFLARQISLDRLVALKILQPKLAEDREFLARFHREAKAAALFQHPNVAAVIDAGQDTKSGVNYIAFEFIDGGSLEDRLRKQRQLPEEEALFIARGIAQALAFAESKGVIHRDVKPDNILLGLDGTPKLADLGLAKSANDQAASLTQTGVVMGTPLYMAPEQALNDEALDVRADIYALGLCLWRMLSGVMPFDEDGTNSSLAILTKHINEDLADVRTRATHVSGWAAQVLKSMTARDPADRYPNASDLAKDMDRILAGMEPLGPRGAESKTTMSFDAVKNEKKESQRQRRASSRRVKQTVPRTPALPSQGAIPVPLVGGILIGALGIGIGLAVALSGGPPPLEDPIRVAVVSDAPDEDAPVEDAPVEDAPVEDAPVEDSLAEAPPAEDPPVEDPPAVGIEPLSAGTGPVEVEPLDHPVDPAFEPVPEVAPRNEPSPADRHRLEALQRQINEFLTVVLRDVPAAAALCEAFPQALPVEEFSAGERAGVHASQELSRTLVELLRSDGERSELPRRLEALLANARNLPGHSGGLVRDFAGKVGAFRQLHKDMRSFMEGRLGPGRLILAPSLRALSSPSELLTITRLPEDAVQRGRVLGQCVIERQLPAVVAILSGIVGNIDAWPERPDSSSMRYARALEEPIRATAIGHSLRAELDDIARVRDALLEQDPTSASLGIALFEAQLHHERAGTQPSRFLRHRLRKLGEEVRDGAILKGRGLLLHLERRPTQRLGFLVGGHRVGIGKSSVRIDTEEMPYPRDLWKDGAYVLIEPQGLRILVRISSGEGSLSRDFTGGGEVGTRTVLQCRPLDAKVEGAFLIEDLGPGRPAPDDPGDAVSPPKRRGPLRGLRERQKQRFNGRGR